MIDWQKTITYIFLLCDGETSDIASIADFNRFPENLFLPLSRPDQIGLPAAHPNAAGLPVHVEGDSADVFAIPYAKVRLGNRPPDVIKMTKIDANACSQVKRNLLPGFRISQLSGLLHNQHPRQLDARSCLAGFLHVH